MSVPTPGSGIPAHALIGYKTQDNNLNMNITMEIYKVQHYNGNIQSATLQWKYTKCNITMEVYKVQHYNGSIQSAISYYVGYKLAFCNKCKSITIILSTVCPVIIHNSIFCCVNTIHSEQLSNKWKPHNIMISVSI